MVISGKGLTTSPTLRTKSPNNKQKARTSITEITNQDFRKFLKEFKNSPYLGYKNKQVHNQPTEAYFFLIKQVYKIVKRKKPFGYAPKELNWTPTKKMHNQNN